MVILIVAVLVIGTALIVLSVVEVLGGIVLMVAGLVAALAIGDRLDRDRRGLRGQAASFDADRGTVATPGTFAIPPMSAGSRYDDLTTDAAGTVPLPDAPRSD